MTSWIDRKMNPLTAEEQDRDDRTHLLNNH